MHELRTALMPLVMGHEWPALTELMTKYERDPAAKPVLLVGRGIQRAFEGDDLDGGLALLDEAAGLGDVDGLLQGALVRCLADQAWDRIEAAVERLQAVTLLEDQRPSFATVLEKLADRLQAERKFDRALPLWTALLAIEPDAALAFRRRSRLLFHVKDFASALADANRHVELEPRNRLAWLGRAAVKEALGDVEGAAADRLTGERFYDVDTSEAVAAQAAELLAGDRDENLSTRLSFFDQLGLEHLDLAIIVHDEQWAWSVLPGDDGALDLSFTVGLFYRYGHPELMVHSRDLDPVALKDAIAEVVTRAQDGETAKAGDPLTVGDVTVSFEVPTAADLAKFPYGYGVHFYRHFMDRTDVPLLLARFSRE